MAQDDPTQSGEPDQWPMRLSSLPTYLLVLVGCIISMGFGVESQRGHLIQAESLMLLFNYAAILTSIPWLLLAVQPTGSPFTGEHRKELSVSGCKMVLGLGFLVMTACFADLLQMYEASDNLYGRAFLAILFVQTLLGFGGGMIKLLFVVVETARAD